MSVYPSVCMYVCSTVYPSPPLSVLILNLAAAGTNGKPVETEPAVEPADDDIGGAEDLQDGSIEKRKVDLNPEETSL